MFRFINWFTGLYPVWVISFAVVGLIRPELLTWFNGPWVVWALTLVMLGMGFTLKVEDFRRLFKAPSSLALGFLAHYTIMPLAGWSVAHLLNLDPGFAVGLILVASCPSGTASNVICYLARANVALAVMVTLTSTLLAFLMTPAWCKVLAGQYVPVDAAKLSLSTIQIAVAPVMMGVFCNWLFPKATASASRVGPLISVLSLMFVTGGIVAQNAEAVKINAGKLALAAVLLHLLGFGVGYLVAKILRRPEEIARTISIEVGMQNGGLAAVLAKQNFPLQPLAAVPAIFSAITQTLLGSLLATWWRNHPVPSSNPEATLAAAKPAPLPTSPAIPEARPE
ncbi:bile acid:sodium symporter family protein [Verrucomicrobium sp. BvORR106]|uniref:bile acid:sodium symporter family protein n=1 Tax=Verrucomicrobium sp. BvORR106 TaxID=1403819 RepID=UPI00057033FA|nr:bile acid:sodium symporter family protein [Verrucomicrobium sp. BvORR106]